MPGHIETLAFPLNPAFPCWWDCAHLTDEEPEAHKVCVSCARLCSQGEAESVFKLSLVWVQGHAVSSVLTGQREGALGIQQNSKADK